MELRKVICGPGGIVLELDKREWFPDDPGNGTPVLVRYRGGTASLSCAINEEEVCDESTGAFLRLNKTQVKWLMNKEKEAWDWATQKND